MKTTLPFLILAILLSLPNFCFTQVNIEHIFSKVPYFHINKIIHVDGKTFVGGKKDDCYRATIIAFDENGDIEWEVATNGCSEVTDMFFRPSDSVLVIASVWSTACNFLDPEFDGPHLFSLDMNGNYVFDIHMTVDEFGSDSYADLYLATNSDEEIILSNGENLYWADNEGIPYTSENYPGNTFKHILTYNDNLIISSSNNQVFFLDNNGSILSDLPFSNPVLDLDLDGDNLYILTADKVFNFHLPTETLSSEDSFAGTMIATGFSYDDNWIYLWGHDQQDIELAKIGQLDKTNFNPIEFIELNQDDLFITDIFSDGTQLFIAGDKLLGDGPDQRWFIKDAFVKTTNIFSPPTYLQSADISISNFVVIQPSEVIDYDPIEELYTFANSDILFEYDVYNEGTDTVFRFSMFTQAGGGIFCEEFRLFKHFVDLIIPPGENVTISAALPANVFHFAPEIRLEVFAPNHRFDGNPEDNSLSGTDFIVSVECNCGLLDTGILLYPNPASNILNVHINSKNFSHSEKLRLVNIQGQVLVDFDIPLNDSNYELSVEKYSPGIYFVQYLKDKQVVDTKKIIIKH